MQNEYKNELLECIREEENHCEHCRDRDYIEICLNCGVYGNIRDFEVQLNELN